MPREIYINPYTDFGFKRLFGEEASKDLLRDFLNTLLPPEHQIADLSFQNTERLGRNLDESCYAYDIYCKNEKGESFIVEMQKANQRHFINRAIAYVCDIIRGQKSLSKSSPKSDYYNLVPVYFVGILGFRYDGSAPEVPSPFRNELLIRRLNLRDQEGVLASKLMEIILIQMPVFDETKYDLGLHQNKWLYFLKNLPSFEHIPSVLGGPIFQKAFALAEYAAMPPSEQSAYDESARRMEKYWADIGTAEWIGEKRGLAQGEQIGRDKERLKMAADMKIEGIPAATISKITGFPISEIENL